MKKYSNNPVEIAKELKVTQDNHSRLVKDLKVAQNKAPEIVTLTEDQIAVGTKVYDKEDIIAKYTKLYPNDTEDMSDEQILFTAKKEFEVTILKEQGKQSQAEKDTATEIKKQLIANLGEADKEYASEIKEMLDNSSDARIIADKDGSFAKDCATFIKGQNVDALKVKHADEVKKAKSDGFKAGQESVRLKGGPVGTGNGFTGKAKKPLSTAESKRAWEAYGDDQTTQEEAEDAFRDVGLEQFRKENK